MRFVKMCPKIETQIYAASQLRLQLVFYYILISVAIAWNQIESKAMAVAAPNASSQARVMPMSHRMQALYNENLAKYRGMSVSQLAAMFPNRNSQAKSAINLTTVKYYRDFMADPAVANAETRAKLDRARSTMTGSELNRILYGSEHHELKKHRQFDFRLNKREIDKLQKQGLVVSERLQVDSFAEGYYRTYTDDLPVYITADSVLHAWHRSYDAILKEIESLALKPRLESMTRVLIDTTHELRKQHRVSGRQFRNCLNEIEFFLGIGAELLLQARNETGSSEGEWNPYEAAIRGPSTTQNTEQVKKPKLSRAVRDKVKTALNWIKAEQMQQVEIFGKSRDVDFSLFIPRGHYTTSASLKNYFQAMMWFGTIDFRVAGSGSSKFELLCALVFGQVVREADVYDTWLEFDKLLTLLVGEPDSMTLGHLIQLMGDADLIAYFSATPRNESFVNVLKQRIVNSGTARQVIAGHPIAPKNPSKPKPTELPLSFTFFGQRFLVDSFVLSKVVYDNVIYNGTKLFRRIPSGLDVAFAVFQNNATLAELTKRIQSRANVNSSDHVRFRDGYEYSSNLAALRLAADQLEPKYMSSTILNRWLDALRTLSKPASHHSSTSQSSEWRMKQLATQLASWTQLRHDNMLYVKQSYTIGLACEYPAGFVEPYPEFWHKMKELAEATVFQLNKSSIVSSSSKYPEYGFFFNRFAGIMSSLEEISKKQAVHANLTDDETRLLKTVMEERRMSGGSRYMGWYPKLFYVDPEDSGKEDYLVADVHTDAPDEISGDPGSILHAGVGKVLTAFVVVEHEDGKSAMYAGPVYSYYEFTTPINQRLTDKQWADKVKKKQTPIMPSWATESFLLQN